MPPYTRTGSIKAKPGQRDALLAILKDAAANAPTMPGCLTYEVRAAIDDPDAIFVSEVWVDEASHAASLRLESVRAAIARARPLIA